MCCCRFLFVFDACFRLIGFPDRASLVAICAGFSFCFVFCFLCYVQGLFCLVSQTCHNSSLYVWFPQGLFVSLMLCAWLFDWFRRQASTIRRCMCGAVGFVVFLMLCALAF